MKNWLSKKIHDTGLIEKVQEKVSEGTDWMSAKIEKSEFVEAVQEKVTNSKEWMSEKLDSSEVYGAMQKNLSEKMEGAFESVIDSKKAIYLENPNKRPVHGGVEAIIKACAMENAAISGGASLVPGPWGMVAVVPEIAVVMRNQIAMVYDIGVANGKESSITKELLVAIVMSALGTGVSALVVMHGSKVLVKRSSLRVFQKVISILAGKVTQQALKSAISKWLPIVGAAFMAWLSGRMTQDIGRKANEIFQKEIEVSDAEISEIALETEQLDAAPPSLARD